MKKVVKEFPDDTSPVVMNEYVNDEDYDKNKRNLVKENETKLNDED